MRIVFTAVAAIAIASSAAAETKTWTNKQGGKLVVDLREGGKATARSWDKTGKKHRDLKGTWEQSGDLVKVKWNSGETKCYPAKDGGEATSCK